MTLFAGDLKAGTKEQLAVYRDQIDSLDQRIVELIQERARRGYCTRSFGEMNRSLS